jgi:ketosteroid isomerase-like protein
MERDLEKIEELYRAQQKRDIRSILMLMSPDVEIMQSTDLPGGGHYLGHDGVKKFLATLAGHIDSQVHVERLIDAGEKIAVVGRTVGKTRKFENRIRGWLGFAPGKYSTGGFIPIQREPRPLITFQSSRSTQ